MKGALKLNAPLTSKGRAASYLLPFLVLPLDVLPLLVFPPDVLPPDVFPLLLPLDVFPPDVFPPPVFALVVVVVVPPVVDALFEVVVVVVVVVVLALPFVFSVVQPLQKAATASRAKRAKVLRIEFPPVIQGVDGYELNRHGARAVYLPHQRSLLSLFRINFL